MCRLFWRTPPPPAGPDASVCDYVGYYLGPVGRNPVQNFAVGPGFLGLWRRPLGACAVGVLDSNEFPGWLEDAGIEN